MAGNTQDLRSISDRKIQRFKTSVFNRSAWMGRFFIGIFKTPFRCYLFLVIIDQVHVECVTVFELEYYSPVAGDLYGPKPFQFSL